LKDPYLHPFTNRQRWRYNVGAMSIAHFKNEEELLGFAREFFDNRVETFQNDIAICRTPDAEGRHAYFPA
jgi:hypothetical protein